VSAINFGNDGARKRPAEKKTEKNQKFFPLDASRRFVPSTCQLQHATTIRDAISLLVFFNSQVHYFPHVL
jgi:hypothetical protein